MDKLKWMCDYYNNNPCDGTKLGFEKDRAFGFSWPQRNYGCSFCKKEFKSAQALGGHMNVHRRDRARLRQLSPNPNPNPHPHPPFVLPSTPMFVPYMPCHSSLTAVINSSEEKVVPPLDLMENIDLIASTKEARVWKSNECIRLDLNLNLFQDAAKEDLDLELRLGSS